jgi:hypothetical protein
MIFHERPGTRWLANRPASSGYDAWAKLEFDSRQAVDRRSLFAPSLRRGAFHWVPVVAGLMLLAIGCAEPIPGPNPAADGTLPATEMEPPPGTDGSSSIPTSPQATSLSPEANGPTAGMPSENAAPSTAATTPGHTGQPATPDVERVTADVGVGQRGRSLDKHEGAIERMIVQPARTLFAVRERMVFSTQIPQALQLYKATHGRGPTSHEDFLRDIIQANNIRLPELPEGQRYVYDLASEELLVERPAR